MWEATTFTTRKLRLALVSEARSLGYIAFASKLCSEAADAPPIAEEFRRGQVFDQPGLNVPIIV